MNVDLWQVWRMIVVTMTLSSCVSVKPVVVDQKTQLENQVLGSIQQLDKELILLSSVRSAHSKSTLNQRDRRLYGAIASREFNADDISTLKTSGIIGENRRANLSLIEATYDAQTRAFAMTIIAEENEAREILIAYARDQIADTNENIDALVRDLFRQMIWQQATDGDWVENERGQWIRWSRQTAN